MDVSTPSEGDNEGMGFAVAERFYSPSDLLRCDWVNGPLPMRSERAMQGSHVWAGSAGEQCVRWCQSAVLSDPEA